MDINTKIAEELGIRREQAAAAVKLIDEGCTIPFIARYRKEATGALSDEILRNLYDRLVYLRNLEDKKQTVLASIEEQGKLTEELRAQILAAETQVAVDDLYRPYRPKRRTRATIAKEKGLEPLANLILLQKMTETPLEEAKNISIRKRSQHRRRCLKRCKRYPCRVGLRQCRFPYPYPGTDYEARTAFIRCKRSRSRIRL